ncbi:hypothetical protein HYPSUDRAFT_199499 [Hypholoma sublateritium FD-334 SS-4]|uniref:Uncharacterized protein n=1 Tax=Hypholoma sublateritium (strain FD-334 SS-4) TaxID=945553 RepID=A0A0D2Q2L9_HYPSF|nr:hypothetical protein HYPSUDRAFT_199499 [Hypholoma sublateritium FD-334 SS-4]
MAHRPRDSILSLFDPLSLSSTSDKENNVGESSFFRPSGPRTPAQHIPRRRLIDIGDMTVDEPDMHDLLAMEEELEEIKSNITENDDGDTLTWRDMAKAATPKWSGRRATAFTTPKASPTPRTPLSELSFKDEVTPIAHSKSYRKQMLQAPSKLARVDSPPTSPISTDFSAHVTLKSPSDNAASSTIIAPVIKISDVDPDAENTVPCVVSLHGALGSSVCTLDLPTASENLMGDSSFPLNASVSSPQSSDALLTLPLPQPRLRPNASSPANSDNRMSIDLHSSFQLHLSSSDTTFDLLNEKISFFSSKSGMDSFLKDVEIDTSFGEDDLDPIPSLESNINNGIVSPKSISPPKSTNPIHAGSSNRVFIPQSRSDKISNDNHEMYPNATSSHDRKHLAAASISSLDEKESLILSTPSTPNLLLQHPPMAVPALKIVKRSKVLSRRVSTAANAIPAVSASTSTSLTTPSRRISTISPAVLPAGRAKLTATGPPSPANSGHRDRRVVHPTVIPATKKSTTPPISHTTGDGPRRVLLSEGPKLISLSNSNHGVPADPAKASLTVNGPRRIAVNTVGGVTEKPAAVIKPVVPSQSSTGLRQPVKYNAIGSSAIPKPVARTVGSRLPAPAPGPGKSRFGVSTATTSSVPARGLQGRRAT